MPLSPEIQSAIDAIDGAQLTRAGAPEGLYGFYVHTGPIGIKCQQDPELVHQEFEYLRLVEPSGITPKAYCVRDITIDGCRYSGLFMEHINGTTLADSDLPNRSQEEDRITNEANGIFRKYGIRHGDTHWGNILIDTDGGYRVIDFSPNFISLIGEEEESDSWSSSEDSSEPPIALESLSKRVPGQLEFDLDDRMRGRRRVKFILLTRLEDCIAKREEFLLREDAMEELATEESRKWKWGNHHFRFEVVEVPQ